MPIRVPVNTGIPGGAIQYDTFHILNAILFNQFKTKVCDRMAIDANTAVLGYKIATKDLRSEPWHNLCGEAGLREAITRGRGYISRARRFPERIALEIQNMVSSQVEFHLYYT